MASRKILVAHGKYGPEAIYPAHLVPVYVVVARQKIGSIPKGAVIRGIWDYSAADARVRLYDWSKDNDVPASATKVVKAYVVSYGGSGYP